VALRLMQRGIQKVRPLAGGLEAWRRLDDDPGIPNVPA